VASIAGRPGAGAGKGEGNMDRNYHAPYQADAPVEICWDILKEKLLARRRLPVTSETEITNSQRLAVGLRLAES